MAGREGAAERPRNNHIWSMRSLLRVAWGALGAFSLFGDGAQIVFFIALALQRQECRAHRPLFLCSCIQKDEEGSSPLGSSKHQWWLVLRMMWGDEDKVWLMCGERKIQVWLMWESYY